MTTIGGTKGDTRSVDYGSNGCIVNYEVSLLCSLSSLTATPQGI